MRAGIYLRQSLDRDGDGLAVARQREDCLALCRGKGWSATEYIDNSVSASSRKPRPAYQRMLSDIEAGRLDAVAVYDLDRLHRQPIELEHFIILADKHHLALATVSGDTDLSTDSGRLFARIKGSVSRAEIERKTARQRRAGSQRAESGKPWGPRRPFGFEDDKTSHRPSEADALQWMYDDLIAGVSQGGIARKLNGQGITTTMGKAWTQSSVRAVLTNSRYAGLRTYDGEIVGKAGWEPIVSEDIWRVAQSVMSRKQYAGGGARKHLLVGLARCGVCEATMRTGYTISGARIYECSRGSHVTRNADKVDAYIEAVAVGILAREDAGLLLVDTSAPEFESLKAEADTLRRRLDSLATDFADGSLTASQVRTASERIQANLKAVEAAMGRRNAAAVLAPVIGAADVQAAWDGLDTARKRSVIDVLMEIHIMKTGRGKIFDPEQVKIRPKGEPKVTK